MRKTSRAGILVAVPAALLLIGSPAFADPDDKAGNRDWGKVASNLAQLPTEHSTAPDGSDASGGAMGQHSRSTQAANNNGGFTADGNGFGITFNVRDPDETNNGRLGVGNATRGAPHNQESPSDGGQGQHALNNADAAAILDPVTGDFTTNAGGTAPDFSEELRDGTSADG